MKRLTYVILPFAILVIVMGLRFGQKHAEVSAQTAQRAARMKALPPVSVATARVQDLTQVL